ncbi:MAG: hypothetical protein KAR12_11005 [Methylococcales bacterium]|nr:hypothetical protein [Methylococcales bacterium]
MTKLAQNRVNFLEHLHETFLVQKGHGAFAYISISEAMTLFDMYINSNESADLIIRRFIRSL